MHYCVEMRPSRPWVLIMLSTASNVVKITKSVLLIFGSSASFRNFSGVSSLCAKHFQYNFAIIFRLEQVKHLDLSPND